MNRSIDLIVLTADDNVGTALRNLSAGESIRVAGHAGPLPSLVATSPVEFGHKAALRAIPLGGYVVKHGRPIGRATADIAPGEHVHVHNVVSLSRDSER
jgi:hypothetical protein